MLKYGAFIAIMTLAVYSGCRTGYDNMLFATKANVGFTADSKPYELSMTVSRFEGLLAPTYEGGQTPPVMASFQFGGDGGYLARYLGSTFTTGNAAVTMARLFNAGDWEKIAGNNVWSRTTDDWKIQEDQFDSSLTLDCEPRVPWGVRKKSPCAVRPVLFGTDTSLGSKVSWADRELWVIPEYFLFGFQRRQIAFTPVVTQRSEEGDAWEACAPSLLATVDAAVWSREYLSAGMSYLQYFASGRAANALAMREGVRRPMIRRLDPAQAHKFDSQDASVRLDLQERLRRWLRRDAQAREVELAQFIAKEFTWRRSLLEWLTDGPTIQLRQVVTLFQVQSIKEMDEVDARLPGFADTVASIAPPSSDRIDGGPQIDPEAFATQQFGIQKPIQKWAGQDATRQQLDAVLGYIDGAQRGRAQWLRKSIYSWLQDDRSNAQRLAQFPRVPIEPDAIENWIGNAQLSTLEECYAFVQRLKRADEQDEFGDGANTGPPVPRKNQH